MSIDMVFEFAAENEQAFFMNSLNPGFEEEAAFDFIAALASVGQLNIVLPVPVVSFTAEVTATSTLNITLPVPDVALEGIVSGTARGTFSIVLPVPNVNLDGVSAAGGATVGPCSWLVPEPLCPSETWLTASNALKSAGRDFAALVLWAATGQQYGLCEVTVRPCGVNKCGDNAFDFFGWMWSSGTWSPYILNGVWRNCTCFGACCCDPRCEIRLMGDVNSIVEVLIGGIAVDPATYRVDDRHWLVRIGGECWPECSDLDNDSGPDVLEVTYLRGTPVPTALLTAAATLADEWVRACVGADCRLSNRVTSISRSGIDISMSDPNDLLESGLTGITEIDRVIVSLNPYRRKQRARIYAPEIAPSRMPNP